MRRACLERNHVFEAHFCVERCCVQGIPNGREIARKIMIAGLTRYSYFGCERSLSQERGGFVSPSYDNSCFHCTLVLYVL